MQFEYEFALGWGKGRRLRETDFLLVDSTKLTIDKRPVSGTLQARWAAIDELDDDYNVSVSYDRRLGPRTAWATRPIRIR